MSLAELYREKVVKRVDIARAAVQSRQAQIGIGSNVAGGTFITQNPNEMGVNLSMSSYETSKLTLLEQKQRELRDVHEALAQKKLDYESRLAAVKEREDALKQKQEDLTNFAKKNSEHIHAADAKVCRATRRIESEVRKRREVERQIEEALKERDTVEDQRAATKADLDAHSCYESFLSEVVDKCESFSTIGEVLTRYETLKSTQEELQTANTTHMEAMDTCSNETQALLQETQNEALVLNSQLLNHGEMLDGLVRLNHKLETEFTHLSQGHHGTSRLSAEIQMSVQNLYEITQASYSSSRRRPLTAATVTSGNPTVQQAAVSASRVQMGRSSSMASLLGARQLLKPSESPHTSPQRLQSLLKRVHSRIVELESINGDYRAAQIVVHARNTMPRSLSMKSVTSFNSSETSTLSSGGWDENSPFLPPIFPSACK